MLIIGIDASTNNIGWSVIEFESERRLASGVIRLASIKSFHDRLAQGPRQLKAAISETGLLERHKIKTIVIEQAFFTMGPDIGRKISMMVGACLCILAPWCLNIYEVPAGSWFKMFTGAMKPKSNKADVWSTKRPVINKVNQLYGLNLDVKMDNDQADAIGMAKAYCLMCKTDYFQRRQDERLKNKAKKKANAEKIKKSLEGELSL